MNITFEEFLEKIIANIRNREATGEDCTQYKSIIARGIIDGTLRVTAAKPLATSEKLFPSSSSLSTSHFKLPMRSTTSNYFLPEIPWKPIFTPMGSMGIMRSRAPHYRDFMMCVRGITKDRVKEQRQAIIKGTKSNKSYEYKSLKRA